MSLIVQKYGGTSVGTIERIQTVADKIRQTWDLGHGVVVVVSAMAGETNRLLDLAHRMAAAPDRCETDVLVSTGEQVTIALLAMRLKEIGVPSRSFLGHQVRILTDNVYSKARIHSIDATEVTEALERRQVVVIAGFQGVDPEGNITTLGRGGSDLTAVAVAAAVKADACEIYTDVDGIYTTDPNICPDARKIYKIAYEEMLEMASLGAKVMQTRSVEFAMKFNVPVHVRSSFSDVEGSWIMKEDKGMETVVVAGVTLDKNEAKVTLKGVMDRPGIAARIFGALAVESINVDVIIQNVSEDGRTDVSFTVSKVDAKRAVAAARVVAEELGGFEVTTSDNVAKVSIVGVGMRTQAGVAARMFKALADAGINIEMISTSEIKVSCVIDLRFAELAVRVVHDAFDLGVSP